MNFKKDFPMLNNDIIYFDNCATTLKPISVIDEVSNYYKKYSSNSSRADYTIGTIVDEKILNVRKKAKEFINAESTKEIIFTSGCTFGMNIITNGFFNYYLKTGDEVLTTKAEHASLLLPWFEVSKKTGAKIEYIDLNDDYTVSLDNIKKKVNKNTKVITLAHITNVIGDIRPIKEICEYAHKQGILVVVDAAQSVPHQKIDVKDLDVDFLVFSAHKMLGPTGVGILYGKEKYLDKVKPLILGGGMNSYFDSLMNVEYKDLPEKLEAGTLNIAGILGFGAAIDYIEKLGIEDIHKYEVDLKKYMVDKLSKLKNIVIYNKNTENGIITFNVDGVFSQDVSAYLNKKNICVRVGSHCAKALSEVIGVKNTCRASLYFYNTKEEVDEFIDALNNDNILYDSL